MEFRSLKRKKADQEKIHLAQPTMMFNIDRADVVVREHVVREDDVTRPDLIALEYYGGADHVDYILKWNGISDPFSLSPGDILEIPPRGLAISSLERPAGFVEEDNPIKNQFMQAKNDRLPKKDQRRLDALKKKYNKETLLPPNVIQVGKKNYKFDKEGNIILGAQAQNADVNPANPDPVVKEILAEISSPIGGGQGISSGSGSGSGGGRGLTETQLNNKLNDGQGPRNIVTSAQGAGKGTSAANYGGGKASTDAPQGTGDATNVSNDGAPCN